MANLTVNELRYLNTCPELYAIKRIGMKSRELVEETVNETTNNYRKLANIQLDKESGNIFVTDVDYFTTRDVDKYCDKVKELYDLYLDSIGRESRQ